MKTVSGAVVSSKPVSLSKAAKILSKFALADNGASPAYVAYLKRASDSFAELVQLHKEVRGSGSERKSKKHRSGNHDIEEPLDSLANYGVDGGTENGVGRRRKDVKEKNAGADGRRYEVVLVNGQDEGKDPKKKKKNVMDKSEEKGNGSVKMEEERTRGASNWETFDDSAKSKKRKKELTKIKKVAIEEGIHNGAIKIEKGPSDGGYGVVKGDQFDDMKNEVFKRKKLKKMNKGNEVEKRENKAAADLRNERYAGDGDFDSTGTDSAGDKKKGKKEHIREEEESKAENENEKKQSKKRKSEQIADGELTDSVDNRMHKKKKKGKSEGDN